MRALSDHEVLRVWESGLDEHPIDRALTVLSAVLPDTGRGELAAMSVGRRDGHLMDVRKANFGPKVSGVAECPQCGELLQWDLYLDDIRDAGNAPDERTNRMVMDGHELIYRLPDSTDLAAVALDGDVAHGRDTLLHRCMVEARKDGVRVDVGSLPEDVVSGVAAEMEARDPQAETLLDFECPACGLRWQALFDILPFLWTELQARARNLLNDVHDLARAYGWSEKDILGMSAVRRRYYLEAT
ncbi:MAG TPA: hypothetical protein VFI90_10525 [Rubrobacter sp.]|nr:hypothetical protein [Rubrobacter sp.]